MKHLSYFNIFENNGTTEISKEVFEHLLETNCKDFSWDDTPIYRSVNLRGDFYEMDPSFPFYRHFYEHDGKQYRKSAYTYNNYYTLLLNHLPVFQDFPKRQVICSTNKTFFSTGMYRLIPFDGAKIGIVPDSDIQDRWKCDFFKKFNLPNLVGLNNYFKEHEINDDNWYDFIDSLENPYNSIDIDEFSSVEELNKSFTPESLKLKSVPYNEYKKKNNIIKIIDKDIYERRELWLDSKYLLIRDRTEEGWRSNKIDPIKFYIK
jgi:hypothetical protein